VAATKKFAAMKNRPGSSDLSKNPGSIHAMSFFKGRESVIGILVYEQYANEMVFTTLFQTSAAKRRLKCARFRALMETF